MAGLLSRFTGLLSPKGNSPAPRNAGQGSLRARSEFMRGAGTGAGGMWRPALREINDDVGASWEDATARAADLIQNSGWISGMFDQAVYNTVGSGLRLRVSPENDLFGMSEAQAQEWRKLVERRWELWSRNPLECDIEGRRTIGEMQEAAFRSWLSTGESLAEITFKRRYGSPVGTKVRLLPSARLSRRTDPLNRIMTGVRLDRDGFPTGYLAKRRDPLIGDYDVMVRARDGYGRPRIVHVFQGLPGQVRGITPLVPVMKVAKQFDQLADSTLMASLIQTVFAANITSDSPTEDAIQGLLTPQEYQALVAQGVSPFEAWAEIQQGWYEGNVVDVGINGRVVSTFPGQKLEFLSPEIPNTSYKEFAMFLLREMARCLGMTYESATGDYTGATYSSVRMAVNEVFQITKARRDFIVAPFVQPLYEAWLEEQIELGLIPFPGGIQGFHRNRAAACRALWLGAPKPQADDLKTAKAHQVYRDMGVITDAQIANDLGLDIEDVYAQRAQERALREQYGLPEPTSGNNIQAAELENDGEDEDGKRTGSGGTA